MRALYVICYLVAQSEHLSGEIPATDHCIKGIPFYFLLRYMFFDLPGVLKVYCPSTLSKFQKLSCPSKYITTVSEMPL